MTFWNIMSPTFDVTFHQYEVSPSNGSTIKKNILFVKNFNHTSDSFVIFWFFTCTLCWFGCCFWFSVQQLFLISNLDFHTKVGRCIFWSNTHSIVRFFFVIFKELGIFQDNWKCWINICVCKECFVKISFFYPNQHDPRTLTNRAKVTSLVWGLINVLW